MDVLALLSPEAREGFEGLLIQDQARAERLLRAIGARAGQPHHSVPVLEALIRALAESPDAEMALLNLERWSAHLPTPLTTLGLLREDPRLPADLLALFGGSQYLADILARDPWLYSLLMEEAEPRAPGDFGQAVAGALHTLQRPEARRDALRRVKRREFLRIGWRDMARRAPLEEVVREISDLADALVEAALRLAHEEADPRFPIASASVAFSVIAMGKLGARELNYSSDIDLMFVMDSPAPQDEGHRRYAARLAETLIQVLAQETPEGRCFRVDMRLRPEGRSGSLVRSFAAYRAYYDRWVETWERQALIKARFIAGDHALGRRFEELVRPVTYRRIQGATLLEDVREMRAAVERKLDSAGVMDSHVKEGRGTIRDVEFTVQLLQLLFGADLPGLQARDTVSALRALREAGLFTAEEERAFLDGYRFFREVEHRLQLLHDLPARLVPEDPVELRRIARSMGFDEAAPFREAYRRHSEAVRALAEGVHERLGVESGNESPLRVALLSADTPAGEAVLRAELEKRGFPDADGSVTALVRLAAGDPHYRHPAGTRRLFADLAPALLRACGEAADAGLALQGVADLAGRKLLHRALYQTLLEHPEALSGLSRFAGGAPRALAVVLRCPELSDLVTDQEELLVVRDRTAFADELRERLERAGSHERRLSALRRFKLRELVRMAARHVLHPAPAETETREWSDLADALLEAGLGIAAEHLRREGRRRGPGAGAFAVLALGRYGGQDLHFSSDLDLLYVFDDAAGLRPEYELLAQTLGGALQSVTEEGALFDLDLRLRPEGRQGFSVASLSGARSYYGEGGRAQTWELQMLTRLRFVAGDADVAQRFRESAEPRVYRDPMPGEWRDEIAAMKRRIETERVTDAERGRHLKLGPGGLSDIEFLTQYLQLAHGGANPALRVTGTTVAIRALAGEGVLAETEANMLLANHGFLTRLRQTLWLLRSEGSPDVLPSPAEERLRGALARAVGFRGPSELDGAYREYTSPVRQLLRRYVEGEKTHLRRT